LDHSIDIFILQNYSFQANLQSEINNSCRTALLEDLGLNINDSDLNLALIFENLDITANLIQKNTRASARLISRESGILCGQAWVEKTFALLTPNDLSSDLSIHWHINDGEQIKANDLICEISGCARQILTGERSAMNFLQSLSSTATLTAEYIKTMGSDHTKLLDTRKTIPGMRFGQKYAVKIAGGQNHRFGLADAFLIKENHIMACGGISNALSSAVKNNPNKLLEIEVENLEELQQAIDGKAEVVMLDNFLNADLVKAVSLVRKSKYQPKLEASGNVNLKTIAAIAKTGIDFISVGALTKDIKALDLSMRITLVES
jgi:nicotinate-nucleotide pyrophosphorylase (carboxylating)